MIKLTLLNDKPIYFNINKIVAILDYEGIARIYVSGDYADSWQVKETPELVIYKINQFNKLEDKICETAF